MSPEDAEANPTVPSASPSVPYHLLVWSAKAGVSEKTLESFSAAIAPHLEDDRSVGSNTTRTRGYAVIHTDAPKFDLEGATFIRFDGRNGTRLEDDQFIFEDGEPPGLPAPPLALKTPQPVRDGVEIRFEFNASLDEDDEALLEQVFGIFESAYAPREDSRRLDDEPTCTWRLENDKAWLTLTGVMCVEDAIVRAHAYWLIEHIDQLLPLREVHFVGHSAANKRGLRPSWLGPVVLMIGAVIVGRFIEGPEAVRASMLLWLFGPLTLTFLSRKYVGRLTWLAAFANAGVQAAAAVLIEDPTALWPPPEDLSHLIAYHAELESNLSLLMTSTRAFVLLWVAPYLMSRRRPF